MSYVSFVDVTGVNSAKVPAVALLGIIALYATGSDGIEATAAEIARFKNAGVGVVLIDQTPSLSVFAAGVAHVAIADVETDAGTFATAIDGILARQARGEQSTIYLSYSNLDAFLSKLPSTVDRSLLSFGIADYAWSIADAKVKLAANPDWAYCQYGDPESNPNTLVPGTSVTLSQAQCDIDVADASWADQFKIPPPRVFTPPKAMSQTTYATVDFGWSAITGAASYHFQLVTASKTVLDISTPTPALSGVKVDPGTVYYWRVAVDAAAGVKASPWTGFVQFTP